MNRLFLIALAAFCAGCASKPVESAGAAAPAKPERRTENATLWSGKTELYLEYPALVQGEASRFAIHLTRLSDFKPVPAGRASVVLRYEGGASETFASGAPSKAGIFGVTVKPSRNGKATVDVVLNAPGLADTHRLQAVPVYPTLAQAPTGDEPAKEETMPFLKEQQWAMDFGTGLATRGEVHETMEVPAEVSARSGGQADVTAPLAGRLLADNMPVLGTRVEKGQVLATVVPSTSVPNDRAALDLAKAEGELAVSYARKDRERAARLVEAGAVPQKRLEESSTAEAIATARLHSAEERIRQFDSSRAAEGGAGSPAFSIRAPIAGTIVETLAASGMNLKGGETLFRIVDTDRVYVSAIVPEADFPRIRGLTGAEIEIPGLDKPRPAGRLISIGKIVDAPSRTFPVVYEFANADARIAINQTVTVRLFLARARQAVLIPETALVDDGGRPVVFLQRGGETFVRRPVTAGYRHAGLVEISEGLQAGDRIVTTGAYLIRLSALSSQIPAHGHVH